MPPLVRIGAPPDGRITSCSRARMDPVSAPSVGSRGSRDLKRRRMRAPAVAVGDGCHKIANGLDKLPKRLQPKATRMLRERRYAATRAQAERGLDRVLAEFTPKYDKAATCLAKARAALLTHFDLPAAHWQHLRTTPPIASVFATVRLRQRITKGAGTRTKALTMAFKLIEMAAARWRKLDAAHLPPRVRAGMTFVDGVPLARHANEEARKHAA